MPRGRHVQHCHQVVSSRMRQQAQPAAPSPSPDQHSRPWCVEHELCYTERQQIRYWSELICLPLEGIKTGCRDVGGRAGAPHRRMQRSANRCRGMNQRDTCGRRFQHQSLRQSIKCDMHDAQQLMSSEQKDSRRDARLHNTCTGKSQQTKRLPGTTKTTCSACTTGLGYRTTSRWQRGSQSGLTGLPALS